MKVIDDKFRAKLKKLATEFFSNRDRAIITKLNVEMLIPAGIDYKEYVQPGKSLLKKFFEQFPDIFRVFPAEMNGGRQVLVELATPISWEACAEEFGLWLIGVVNEQYKGKMLDSYFPAVLEKYASPRIKSIRALYTKGQKAMLDDLAARGLIIHDTSDPTGGALNVQTKGVSTPVKTDGGEVGYMHSISFMGYWNSEKTKLKKICADPDINYSEVVAHNFIRSILLNKVRTADTVQGRRYIFDTGLKTETNEIIYGVMEENPLFATNQSTHRYLRDMWAYNGMNVEGEEAELWEEIYNQCNLGSEAPNAFYIREKVVSKINTIDVMIEKADAVLSDIGNTIKSGKQIDRDLIEFIEEYYNVYESIKENLVYFNIRADEDLSVSVIEEKINSKNINMTVLDEIKHLVKELCGLYTELFTKYGLMTYKIEEDIIEFSALLEEGADAPDKISECYEKLGVYSDFAYSDKRSQEHMDYFGITVQMALINAAIGNDASINDIASVVEKIKDRRNYLYYEEIDDENSELHYAVGENGVSVAISKSWETDGEAILVDKISEYFPKLTDLEEIIVSGTKEELEKYIDDNSYIIDEEIDSEIISSLVYENLFDKLECAKRLYAVERNKNRQAEHMLLRADKSVETVKLLLDIMNEEERAEDYWHIFSKTEGMTGIGLSYYCDAMRFKPDKISELVANHPELEYCAQSAELLIAHYETEGNEAAAQKCRENLEKFSSINLNIFEMAVVEGRFDDAKKYVEENITDTDTFSVDMVADIGQRLVDASKKNNCGALALYAVQKNHRATAEALLWQEVFSDEREDVLCTLSEILYQEKRHDEFKNITDVYGDIVFEREELRKANIIYSINNKQENLESLMLDNICDFMDSEIKSLLLEGNVANVYTNPVLFEAIEKVDDEVKEAIVCMGADLRKLFEQGVDLGALGYTEQEVAYMGKCFKAENYPKGKTMIETADRIYSFILNKDGLAQCFYTACLPDESAAGKLCEIYFKAGEYQSAYDLFCEYEQMSQDKAKMYMDCLVELGKSEEFIEFYENAGDELKDSRMAVKYCCLAGALRDNDAVRSEYKNVIHEEIVENKELCEQLIGALNERSMKEEVYEVLSHIFNRSIENMEYDGIYNISTASGIIDILMIEQYVDTMDNNDDMLYQYWEKCVLKEFSEEKFDELYNNAIGQIQEGTYEVSKIGFTLLLFPERAEEIAENLINQLKADADNKSDLAELIIKHCSNYIEENRLLTQLDTMKNELDFSDLLFMEQNYRENRNDDMMLSFICEYVMNNITEKEAVDATDIICSLIDEALEKEYLNVCKLELVSQTLTKLISLNPQRSLLIVMNKLFGYFNDSRNEVVTLLLNKTEQESTTEPERGISDILKDTIENNTPERIVELCRQWSAMEACVRDSLNEEENSQELKTWFVIRNCENADGWNECKQLPMCQNELIYSKVLYICIRHGLSDWKDYIDYCFKHDLYENGLLGTYEYLCAMDIEDKSIIGIQKMLCSLADVENIGRRISDKTVVERILEKIIIHYQTPKGHTYEELRAIILIAECFDAEEYLLSNSVVLDSLIGEYNSAGIAIAGKLLLKGEYALAEEFINRAGEFSADNAFCGIVNDIIRMTPTEREDELKKKEVIDFIEIMQPMGQYPSYTEMKEYLLPCIQNHTTLTAARALYKLLKINPNDGTISICLYLAAKYIDDARYMKEKCIYIQNSLYTWLKHSVYKFKEIVPCIIMLSAANLYIGKEFPEVIGSSEDIDGSMTKSANVLYNELAERIDLIEREGLEMTAGDLMDISNGQEQINKSIVEAVMTGDWSKVLVWLYNNNRALNSYSRLIKINGAGIMKNIISAYNNVESDVEGVRFLEWVKNEAGSVASMKNYVKFIFSLTKHQKYRGAIQTIIDIPFEEKVIFAECVKMYTSRTSYEADTLACGLALGACITHYSNLKDEATWVYTYINKNACDNLNARNYTTAYMLFGTLENLFRHFDIFIDADGKKFVSGIREKGVEIEKRQALKRIAAILAEDSFTIEKFARGLSVHSCINICTSCLGQSIADEYNLLKYRMTRENQLIADMVYDIVCKREHASEKLKWIDMFEIPEAMAGLYFVLNKVAGGATKEGREAWDKYAESGRGEKQSTYLYSKPHPAAYSLIEYDFSEIDKSIDDEPVGIPEYVEKLNNVFREFYDEAGAVSEIEEEYGYIQFNDVEKRRIKAYRIYRAYVNSNSNMEYLGCVNLGIAEYRYQKAASDNRNDKNIITLFFEIFDFAVKTKTINDELKMFVTNAIKDIVRSYSDVDTLTESFLQNEKSFNMVAKLLASDQDIISYRIILKNLTNISNAVVKYRDVSQEQELCTELIKLNRDNSDNRNMGASWRDTYYSLKTLLSDKIGILRARPILECDVLSRNGLHDGAVFGHIKNIGTTTAYDVKIKILFNDGSISNDYEVSRIDPDVKVPFKIAYYVDSDVDAIEFSVHCSYFDRDGKEFPMPPENAVMRMVSRENAKLPSGYDLNTLQFSVVNDERNMYGRMSEIKFLEDAVKGEFREYKNTVIRGLRRSGKSSLLNYMVYYIQNNCDKVIPVDIDCEAAKGSVYSVFVEKFHESLRKRIKANEELSELIDIEQISELFATISAENFSIDRLSEFYLDLSKLLGGYRLILVFDEFDTVLSYYAGEENNADISLHRSLRELTNNSVIREYVHFVFCGSDLMYKFEKDGGSFHQFFQSLNSLDIGNMGKEDMRDMLVKSFALDSDESEYNLQYTPEAIDWIYHYTRGMVWHTKLLANSIISELSEKRRNVVYPSDVCKNINVLSNGGSCEQLWIACEETEKRIIGAMQHLINKPYGTVDFDTIVKAVGETLTAEQIRLSLKFLTKLGLIEVRGNSYYFPNELYRKYFKCQASKKLGFEYYVEPTEPETSEVFNMVSNKLASWL